MRTSKRWTNATFTKRIDHEAGKHRGPTAPKGSRICRSCGAMYAKRRWTLGTPSSAPLRLIAAPGLVLCPACRMAAEGQFAGEVRLSGDFVRLHRDEIEHLIRNEADRAAVDNPMGRILRLDRPGPDRLTVKTSTEHLAQRLGHAVQKSFHGHVHYGFSHENKFAHVTWSREA